MAPNRVSAGDYTGKQKAGQAKDAQQELRDRAAETSLATAVENHEQATGVFDPHTQTRVDGGGGDLLDTVEEVLTDAPVFPENGGFGVPVQTESELILTGYETEEQMTPLLASKPERPVVPQVLLRSPMVKIRVNQDVEDMTYGFRNGEPNNMTFREGFIYEVDVNVAEHLNDRGIIAQWLG